MQVLKYHQQQAAFFFTEKTNGIDQGKKFPGVQCLGFRASTAEALDLTPGWRTKIPQASWCSLKKERIEQKIL